MSSETPQEHTEGPVHFAAGTVRAKGAAETPNGSDMTAIFGTLYNTGDAEVTLTGFTTSLGDARYEIHEVVDGVMQEKEGGVTIPAGQDHEFTPGSDHLMVMDFAPEVPAGSTIELTLEFADGSTVVVPDVAVRTMGAGHEEYGEGGNLQGHQHGTGENPEHTEHTESSGHSGH